jgi:hypothetical protein
MTVRAIESLPLLVLFRRKHKCRDSHDSLHDRGECPNHRRRRDNNGNDPLAACEIEGATYLHRLSAPVEVALRINPEGVLAEAERSNTFGPFRLVDGRRWGFFQLTLAFFPFTSARLSFAFFQLTSLARQRFLSLAFAFVRHIAASIPAD